MHNYSFPPKKLQALDKLKRRLVHWRMKKEYSVQLKQETLSRWQEVVNGKTVSNQAVIAWLNSWGTPEETDKP